MIELKVFKCSRTFTREELRRLGNGEGTSNKECGYRRFTKVDFPKFSGEDVNGWLYRVQQFFLNDILNEDTKHMLVSMHLYDKALECHKQFVKFHGENMLWNVYEKEIVGRFNKVFEDPMVEIKNLKRDVEVKVYQEQFEVLLNRLELVESYVVSLFIGGLKSKISIPVRMFKPNTLKYAFCLARMQEATLALTKIKPMTQFVSQSSSTDNTNKTVKSGFRKRFTQKELEEKMWIQGKQIITEGQWKQAHLASMIVCTYPAELMQVQGETTDISTSKLSLQHLLDTYVDILEMPTEFPSQRTHDHAIKLLPNTPPVTMRPYKLPPNQTDVVEQMVK
nr:hypothetical protein [Tanacetum cinerariifolium]